VLEGGLATPVAPKLLHVALLDEQGQPLRKWSFDHAWPVKWDVEAFGSRKNEVALEKIELSYRFSRREL
jgi:phage tail-like protein